MKPFLFYNLNFPSYIKNSPNRLWIVMCEIRGKVISPLPLYLYPYILISISRCGLCWLRKWAGLVELNFTDRIDVTCSVLLITFSSVWSRRWQQVFHKNWCLFWQRIWTQRVNSFNTIIDTIFSAIYLHKPLFIVVITQIQSTFTALKTKTMRIMKLSQAWIWCPYLEIVDNFDGLIYISYFIVH